jgi:hypothetical protein
VVLVCSSHTLDTTDNLRRRVSRPEPKYGHDYINPAGDSLSLFFIKVLLPVSIASLAPLVTMPISLSIVAQVYHARWYIVAVLLASYIIRKVRTYRRLSHIKGPWLAHFSELWLLATIYQQKAHYVFYDTKKKYGAWLKFLMFTKAILD